MLVTLKSEGLIIKFSSPTFILNISLILLCCDDGPAEGSSLPSMCSSSLLCAVVSAGAVVRVGLSGGVPGGVVGVFTIFVTFAFGEESCTRFTK